ncbi:hypothetical protein [Streptomyces sp. NPDC048350]|uniref:hypothetical protein n=1 Tax=Streptomyces sp. NPDC048350 TaxID=3365538 RepID=UPI0037209BA8
MSGPARCACAVESCEGGPGSDPAEWMLPLPDARCRYVGEWTATKLRWGLSADQIEAGFVHENGFWSTFRGGSRIVMSAVCGRMAGLCR